MNVQISQADIFPMPVFQIPVPEMRPYDQELLELFEDKLKSGELKSHENGYGYQTKINLFDSDSYPQPYLRQVLMAKFHTACAEILKKTVTDFAEDLPYQWVNTFNAGWAVLQTHETWAEEVPWHTHLPAVLSGCYYVTTAQKQGEGLLQFMNPGAPNIFQPKVGEIAPQAGHMVIFSFGIESSSFTLSGKSRQNSVSSVYGWPLDLSGRAAKGPGKRCAQGAVSAHAVQAAYLRRRLGRDPNRCVFPYCVRSKSDACYSSRAWLLEAYAVLNTVQNKQGGAGLAKAA